MDLTETCPTAGFKTSYRGATVRGQGLPSWKPFILLPAAKVSSTNLTYLGNHVQLVMCRDKSHLFFPLSCGSSSLMPHALWWRKEASQTPCRLHFLSLQLLLTHLSVFPDNVKELRVLKEYADQISSDCYGYWFSLVIRNSTLSLGAIWEKTKVLTAVQTRSVGFYFIYKSNWLITVTWGLLSEARMTYFMTQGASFLLSNLTFPDGNCSSMYYYLNRIWCVAPCTGLRVGSSTFSSV